MHCDQIVTGFDDYRYFTAFKAAHGKEKASFITELVTKNNHAQKIGSVMMLVNMMLL